MGGSTVFVIGAVMHNNFVTCTAVRIVLDKLTPLASKAQHYLVNNNWYMYTGTGVGW